MGGLNLPAHYHVPGHGAIGFISAVLDRDADVETPSQAFMRGNVLKYVVRAPRKGGVDDYRKAIDYLQRLVDDIERGQR